MGTDHRVVGAAQSPGTGVLNRGLEPVPAIWHREFMASQPIEPATLYLAAVLTVFGVWVVGDRIWVLGQAIVARPRPRHAISAKLVATVVGAMFVIMLWRAAPVGASVVPQQHRTIVQVEQFREPSEAAMTLRTLMSSESTMLSGTAARSTHGTYVVAPGDCLWKIARSLLTANGLPSSGSATSDLWRSIYDLNREVIGPNPHLIFPGQALALPGR